MPVKRGLGAGVGVGVGLFFLIFVFFFLPFFLLFVCLFLSFLLSFFPYDNNGNTQRLGTNREIRAEYHGMPCFQSFFPLKWSRDKPSLSHVGRTNSIMEGGGGVHSCSRIC